MIGNMSSKIVRLPFCCRLRMRPQYAGRGGVGGYALRSKIVEDGWGV